MTDKRSVPKELKEQQELRRQDSINKVLRAISDLEDEGKKVTITSLMEYTGLSRAVFSKEHIRKLLTEYGYSKKEGNSEVKKKTKKTKKTDDKDRIIEELRTKNMELENECRLLRGRVFLLMQKK